MPSPELNKSRAPSSDAEVPERKLKKKKNKKRKRHAEDAADLDDDEPAVAVPPRKHKKRKDDDNDGRPPPPLITVPATTSNTNAIMNAIVAAAANQTQVAGIGALSSTEDILKVLQGVDVDKVADMLRNVGGGSNQLAMPSLQATLRTPAPQPAAGPSNTSASGSAPVAWSFAAAAAYTPAEESFLEAQGLNQEADHSWMLANKWMSPSRLGLLGKTQGLQYKKGKFSSIEEDQLKASINNFRQRKGLTDAQIQDIIFPKDDQDKDNAFWTEITASVPQRPIIAVYHHIRRARHPLKHQGKWGPQEDAELTSAVQELGLQWEKISLRVGRTASDCRDRYRNHIVDKDSRTTGTWTKEEESKLIEVVTDLTVKQNKDWDNDVFWTRVSALMDGKRGRQQCRIKWTDSLSRTVKNEGEKIRWSPRDAYVLVHKVDAMKVRHDTEIDWKTLSDPTWNLWSPHVLQRRWHTMKKSIKGHEDLNHQEVVDILKTKKAQVTDTPAPRRRKGSNIKKVTSAEMIDDEQDEQDDVEIEVDQLTGDPNIDPALNGREKGTKASQKGKGKAKA